MTDAIHPPPAPMDTGAPPRPDPGSFRDPGNRVFRSGTEVYRALDERSLADWERLARSRFFTEAVAAGRIVSTEPASEMTGSVTGHWAGVVRHERIPVISYPYEWTFSMLKDAALLQLDLLAGALAEDMILKDSTPYNVQWRGSRPVFIDIGSFERLEPGDVWVGYRQFLQQYLYPLMLRSHVDVPFQPWLRGDPEGLTAQQLRRLLPARALLNRAALLHVVLQARAERRYRRSERDVRSELRDAGFRRELIQANVRGLRDAVTRLDWHGDSEWNRYADECGHVAVQRRAKSDFLAASLAGQRPQVVWDVGANDGHFSRQAAASGGYVVAIDSDEVVLDELYRSLAADRVDTVQPLLQDIADPSPGLGWRGTERAPLALRSSPDLVVCFAVIHHLVAGRNLPLREVVDWLADIGGRVVLEFVPPDDPMVCRLVANKRPHEVHTDYTEDALRSYIDERFMIDREEAVPEGKRRLFALRPLG